MAKKAAFLSIPVALERESQTPLWQQLYGVLRDAVLDGGLRRGTRLPPTRALARELGVGRNTVNNAYDQLVAEGYLEGRQGAGTFVSEQLPEEILNVRKQRGRRAADQKQDRSAVRAALSPYGRVLLETQLDVTSGSDLLPGLAKQAPFRPGIPALDSFPHDLWRKLVNRRWRKPPASTLDYGDVAGYAPLREAIASDVSLARGVRCTAEQVFITAGTQQALALASQVLLSPGDAVWFEDPGYVSTRGALTAFGARIVPVPVDEEGLVVEAGRQAAPEARLVYVSPSHQYPTGAVMSLSRRLSLLEWARQNQAWIIEDDYDSEYRYSGHPIAALQGLDNEQRVIYIGTFSKVLFPSLRLGYLIVPDSLVDVFRQACLAHGRASPSMVQAVTADFITEGHFARHIRQMRTIYAERQAALIEAVGSLLEGKLFMRPDPAGLHALAWLADELDADEVVRRLTAADIVIRTLSQNAVRPQPREGLVLGYAAFEPQLIWTAVRKMARILE